MGDLEFDYEAESIAYVRELLNDMESDQIMGFPEPPECIWCRYRLLYDGRQLNDDDILDYVVAADNPTVSVLVTQEPFAGALPEPCECPQCMPPRAKRLKTDDWSKKRRL